MSSTDSFERQCLRFGLTLILVLTFMYEAYDKKAYAHQADNPSKKRVQSGLTDAQRKRLRSLSKWWSMTLTWTYAYLALKYILIAVLYLDIFADYRIYDCYLIGRISFSHNSYKTSLIAIFVALPVSASYRYLTVKKSGRVFNFELFRFALLNEEEVKQNEVQVRERHTLRVKIKKTTHGNDPYGMVRPELDDTRLGKLQFHYTHTLHDHKYEKYPIQLRLSRTPEAWREMEAAILLYCPLVSAILITAGVSLWCAFVLTTAMSTRGFIVNYENCISHIESLGPGQSLAIPDVYWANSSLSASWSIPSAPAWNTYHVLRLTADTFENLFVWVDTLLAIVLHIILIVLQVIDLNLYASALEQNLTDTLIWMQHKAAIEKEKELDQSDYDSMPDKSVSCVQKLLRYFKANDDDGEKEDDAVDECANTQAHLLDFTKVVVGYTNYLRIQTLLVLALWATTTAVLSVWLGDLSTIYHWTQLGLVVLTVFCIGLSAHFELRSRSIYRLVTKAIMMDAGNHNSRRRWCMLISFFQPKPCYCFVVTDMTGFVWIFCVKVFAMLAASSIFFPNLYTKTMAPEAS